ncbi:MAG TPA: hypothetical protein PKU97_01570 [Kofleriaceae bacterium]|nr:hypothetical protein [Kofleriaceae bacterium]
MKRNTHQQVGLWISGALLAAVASMAAGCTDAAGEVTLGEDSAPLTLNDVDVPPECQGILGYVNSASLAALDAYLPSNVASAIVARRATTPFVSLLDLSSVSGIAQARLAAITSAARAANWIGPSCAGVYEELGVSTDDVTAILGYVNSVSSAALLPVLRFKAEIVAPLIIAARPITSVQTLVDIYGVSIETFRSIRDAAIVTPFDLLVGSVNGLHRDAALATAFDLYDEVAGMPGQPTGLACFGVDPAMVASLGGEMLPNLATGAEVLQQVTYTVNYANRYGGVTGIAAGLADLSTQVSGQQFAGCYYSFAPDPWSGVNRSAFINTKTGYRVLTETRWSE